MGLLAVMLGVALAAGLTAWWINHQARHRPALEARAFIRLARGHGLGKRSMRLAAELAGQAGLAPVALLASPALLRAAVEGLINRHGRAGRVGTGWRGRRGAAAEAGQLPARERAQALGLAGSALQRVSAGRWSPSRRTSWVCVQQRRVAAFAASQEQASRTSRASAMSVAWSRWAVAQTIRPAALQREAQRAVRASPGGTGVRCSTASR